MLDAWWDTDEYRKRFVPYYKSRVVLLAEWFFQYPTRRASILQSWYDLGNDLDREYQFRIDNGYETSEIEEAIAAYTELSAVIAEFLENEHADRSVPLDEPALSG